MSLGSLHRFSHVFEMRYIVNELTIMSREKGREPEIGY